MGLRRTLRIRGIISDDTRRGYTYGCNTRLPVYDIRIGEEDTLKRAGLSDLLLLLSVTKMCASSSHPYR